MAQTGVLEEGPDDQMQVLEGAGLLPFRGTGGAFSTLAEFNARLRSAVASGDIDPFWNAVRGIGQMPLIFGDDTAVFLYQGRAESVQCSGDFGDRYVRQGETRLWAFMRRFEPDARVEYKIRHNSRAPVLDPLNPLTETGGLGTSSVVRMPKYVAPECTLLRDDIPHGNFSANLTLASRSLRYRVNCRIYTPHGYEAMAGLPVIYVTDGQDYANPGMGAMVNALDNLIADGRIRPVVAVFIDPRDPVTGSNRRRQQLIPVGLTACPFCDFVALELVPAIDAAYKTDPSPGARALAGFSLGGMFTAHMGLAYPDVFHQLAIQSPYIHHQWILDAYRKTDRLPLLIFLSHGTYDPGAASLRLRDILRAKGYPLRYVETHEGHSYGNVRGVLDAMLTYFFGTASGGRMRAPGSGPDAAREQKPDPGAVTDHDKQGIRLHE